MNINFQSVNYNADSKLIEFAEKRIKKISQFYLNIIHVFIYTKVENTSDRVNKIAECYSKFSDPSPCDPC